ncbi:hypothetical protein ES332_D07G049100v1 [Gossypium tomentosum]|nr:hypothetical protein ES332_D07G049100v1 [Gossypium tomentosum]
MQTKGLRSFLGLLNYARAYIPNMGRLLSPLYAKISPKGEKQLNSEDWKLIQRIKDQVQKLPDLDLAPPKCFIILETDGCMEGWGGVCKWKLDEFGPKSSEKICAYASGKFFPLKSTIDAEIHAAMNSLEIFKIHYLDKPSLTLRTDCQAIISFFNRISNHKPSRIRWVGFTDYITGLGIPVKFEHIKGDDNKLADSLSRLINLFIYDTECLKDPEIPLITEAVNERFQSVAAGTMSRELQQKSAAILACTVNSLINRRCSWQDPLEYQSSTSVTTGGNWKQSKHAPSRISKTHSIMWRKSKEEKRHTWQDQQGVTTGQTTGFPTHEPLTASSNSDHVESKISSEISTQSRRRK